MSKKPTYEELEQRVKVLEKESVKFKGGEEERNQEKELADGIIHSLPGLFYMFDEERFVRWNKRWETITGYSPEELGRMYGPDFFEGAGREHIADRMQEVFREGASTAEAELVTKDGRRIPHFFTGLRMVFDGKPYLIGMGIDITDRKQAEEALQNSKEKYRLLADNVTDVIWVRDMNLHLTYVSPSITHQTGYTVEETMTRPLEETMTPDSLKLALEVYTEELEIERREQKDLFRSRTIELEIKCKDGSTVWTELKMSFLRDQLGNPTGIIGVTRDITDRKDFEAQLQQAYKMEAVGTLAGGIAHDFNNILSSVIGFTELALDDVEKGTQLEDNLQDVYKAGKRAKDLVKQILTFARQANEELKSIKVNTIAKEALKLIRSTIPTTIEIRQNIESDFLIMGNATQIHQIFMNFCTNAAHAMETDGGILEVSLEDVTIDRNATMPELALKPGNYLKVTISDSGTGIAPDIMSSIFEPYFTTKELGEGTGMGLAMVHGIVKSWDGEITVESKVGKGTVFTVYLPGIQNGLEAKPYTKEKLSSGTERILFVDDEPSIAKSSSLILQGLGYKVATRTSSIEALELFRTKPNDFDLVITDMTMPNMTGDRLASELIRIRADIPVILCSGFSRKISEDLATAIGIKAFAYKPVVKADLAKIVRKVLDGKIEK